jgi:DNA-binding response OmpR family regulator
VPHILLVDDDALLRDALHKTLVRAGHDVEDASDGEAALAAYRRRPHDLVITDIVMPNKEGLDTIRVLRQLDPGVKIIAMSGGGLGKADDYLALAQKLGAARVLAKPFTGADIVAAVAEVLAGPPRGDAR